MNPVSKFAYTVGATINQDLIGGGDGYIAQVSHGHPKVRNLFAFGDDQPAARRELARTVVAALQNSNYDLSRKGGVALVVPRLHVYTFDELGITP